MDTKRSQLQMLGCLLSLAAVLCFLTLCGSAASDDQEKQEINLRLDEMNSRCHGTDLRGGMGVHFPNEFADVYLDNQPLTDAYVNSRPAGTHNLRVVTKPVEGQQGLPVVEEIRFYDNDREKPLVDSRTGQPQLWMPNVADANVTFNLETQTSVRITIERCASASNEKAFRVFPVSEEGCKDFDWKSLYLVFSRNQGTTCDLNEAGVEKSLDQGTYEVSLVHRYPASLADRGGIVQPALSKVVVSQTFKSSTHKLEFLPDEAGKAKLNLEKGMWEGESVPEIRFYLIGLCGEVGQIEVVKGQAWIDLPNSTSRKAAEQDTVNVGERIRTFAGSSVELKTNNGYLIKIGEKTKLEAGGLKTESGVRSLEWSISEEGGNIQVIRLLDSAPSKSISGPTSATGGISVKTPTATISDKETNYTVTYDESSKVTTVGVEEGKVEVTPVNSSLQPVTLAANQQLQVAEKSISPITAYTPNGGGNTARILLYAGIGVATMLLLLAAIFLLYRRQHRVPAQPAPNQAGINPGAVALRTDRPKAVTAAQRCPNPQCGKEVPDGKQFCTHCGSRISYAVDIAPADRVAQAKPSLAVGGTPKRCLNPQCGKTVPAGKNFCTHCGSPLKA